MEILIELLLYCLYIYKLLRLKKKQSNPYRMYWTTFIHFLFKDLFNILFSKYRFCLVIMHFSWRNEDEMQFISFDLMEVVPEAHIKLIIQFLFHIELNLAETLCSSQILYLKAISC